MSLQRAVSGICVSLFLAGSWSFYLVSRQAFLNDFNAGVHGYLAGDLALAREKLNAALSHRWPKAFAKELLIKVLLEESLQERRAGRVAQASRALDQAVALAPADGEVKKALDALRVQLERPAPLLPRTPSEFLRTLAAQGRPEATRPAERDAEARRDFLEALAQSQEKWRALLEQQQRGFTRILYGSVAFFSLVISLMIFFLYKLFRLLLGKRGLLAQVAAIQQQLLLLHPATQWTSGFGVRAEIGESAARFRRIDFIEAELVHLSDADTARRLLKAYLEGEDPWARARAAKAMHRLDPSAALAVLKTLLADARPEAQLSAIWGFGELSCGEAVEVLIPLVRHPDPRLQQAAIRCLVQMESRQPVASDTAARIRDVLKEIRAQTDWII